MGKINFLIMLTLKKVKMYSIFSLAGLFFLLIYIALFKMGHTVRASIIVMSLFLTIAMIMDHSALGIFRRKIQGGWHYIKQLVSGGLVDAPIISLFIIRMQRQMYDDYRHIGPYHREQVLSSMSRLNINDDKLEMYGIAAFTTHSIDDPSFWYDMNYGMARKELADLFFEGNIDFSAQQVSNFVAQAGGFATGWDHGGFDYPSGESDGPGSSQDGR